MRDILFICLFIAFCCAVCGGVTVNGFIIKSVATAPTA